MSANGKPKAKKPMWPVYALVVGGLVLLIVALVLLWLGITYKDPITVTLWEIQGIPVFEHTGEPDLPLMEDGGEVAVHPAPGRKFLVVKGEPGISIRRVKFRVRGTDEEFTIVHLPPGIPLEFKPAKK